MSDVLSPPRSFVLRIDVTAHLLGAFAVGSVVLSSAFMVGQSSPVLYPTSSGLDIVDLTPELMVLVAIGLALVRTLPRFAWFVAAAGLFGVAALFLQGDTLQRDQLFALLAISTGLQFAGVLLAFADAGREGRWAIAIGFGTGAIAGKYGLSLVVRAVRESLFSDAMHGDDVIVAFLGVVAAAAGLILLLRSRPAPDAPGSKPTTPWGTVLWVSVAAVAAVVLSRLWQLVLEDIAQSSTGGISQSRAELVESMDLLVRVAIGATVGVILLIVAYRRGAANLARWVVVAFGVAATSAAIPVQIISEADVITQGLIPAALGAVAGAAAVRYADRWFPWDALGLVLVAAAVVLGSDRGRIELPDFTEPAIMIGSFGLGLALTAGLARLTDPGARGLSAPDVSMSAALGVAALVLCQQPITWFAYAPRRDVLSLQLTVPLTMAGAAVVLVVLFGLGRLVRDFRKDLVAEAAGGER
jgi:hypothetical protein